MYRYQIYCSMGFYMCVYLCNHPHSNQDGEHFQHPRRFSCARSLVMPITPPQSPLSTILTLSPKISFACSWTLFKWNHTECTVLYLVSFIQLCNCEIHTNCWRALITCQTVRKTPRMWFMPRRAGMDLLVAFVYSVPIYRCHTPGALQGLGTKDEEVPASGTFSLMKEIDTYMIRHNTHN